MKNIHKPTWFALGLLIGAVGVGVLIYDGRTYADGYKQGICDARELHDNEETNSQRRAWEQYCYGY